MEELVGGPMMRVSVECRNVIGETVDVIVGDL